jgi:exonuclease III
MFRPYFLGSWNIRGLGDKDKCIDVKAALSTFNPDLICLQESKLQDLNRFKASSFLPPSIRSFDFVPSIGASGWGGIITAWNNDVLSCLGCDAGRFSLTSRFQSNISDHDFSVTNVYGSCTAALKQDFLDELCATR